MSATITLNAPVARNINTAMSLVQLVLMIAGLFLVVVYFNSIIGKALINEASAVETAAAEVVAPAPEAVVGSLDEPVAAIEVLTPRMRSVLAYVSRRYRVSQAALQPIFEAAQISSRARGLDPLLVVAVIGIESGFNPLAESTMGAQGLMQVIPRFHAEKVPEGAGDRPFLDPVTNVQVGAHVLQESIRRRGSLIDGLQQYGGASDNEGSYANKVLAEKQRLEQAAGRIVLAGV